MSHPCGQIAQLVEQRTENPRVGSSNLPPGTTRLKSIVALFKAKTKYPNFE